MNERHVCSSRPSNVGMRLGPDVRPTRTLLVSSPARFGVEVSPSPSPPRKITHNNHSCVSNERLGNCVCGDLKLESEASRGGDAGRSFFGTPRRVVESPPRSRRDGNNLHPPEPRAVFHVSLHTLRRHCEDIHNRVRHLARSRSVRILLRAPAPVPDEETTSRSAMNFCDLNQHYILLF